MISLTHFSPEDIHRPNQKLKKNQNRKNNCEKRLFLTQMCAYMRLSDLNVLNGIFLEYRNHISLEFMGK